MESTVKIGQKGIAHLLLLVIAFVGIGIGIYLVQHPAIFKPSANSDNTAPKILSANPNPCILAATGLCTSAISWDTRNNINSTQAKPLKITIKESPGSLFAHSTQGTQNAPWITAGGATFEAYVDGVLVDSLFVKGVTADSSVTPSPSPNTLRNGLISYWNLNEASGNTAADLTNTNNGTVTGTTVIDGKLGKARNFNSLSDQINLGTSTSLGNANLITVSAWVKTSVVGSQTILWHPGAKGDSVGSGRWQLYILNNNKPTFSVYNGEWKPCVGDTALKKDTWYLITGSYDTSKLKIYVNGVLNRSCPQTSSIDITGGNTYIGSIPTDTSGNWKGIIDEAGIWNRVLTDTEIQDLANGATPAASYSSDNTSSPSTPAPAAATPTPVATPTPAPAQPTENPAYQYHYDPNNQGN